MSIAVDFFGDIDRVMDGAFAVDDGVVAINGVAKNEGVMGVDSSTSHTSSTSNDSGIKAFAAREGREYYTHTQYLRENP